MCKIFMAAGIKEKHAEKVWKYAERISKRMSRANRDGLGYAAVTAEGKMFGERWLNNDQSFRKFTKVDDLDKVIVENFDGAVEINNTYGVKRESGEAVYNSFGEFTPKKTVALTMHARMATTPKGLINVHPFVMDGVSLIHNGVIRNVDDFKYKISTCDSETILQSYLQSGMKTDLKMAEKMAGMLDGSYACGVLTHTEQGPILDVFKSWTTSLNAAYIPDMEVWVMSTDKDDIIDTCKELEYDYSNMFTIKGGKAIRIDATTGKRIAMEDFNPAQNFQNRSNTYQRRSEETTSNSGNHSVCNVSKATTNNGKVVAFPHSKFKDAFDAKDPKGVLAYHRSGRPTVTKLFERSIQEDIASMERA